MAMTHKAHADAFRAYLDALPTGVLGELGKLSAKQKAQAMFGTEESRAEAAAVLDYQITKAMNDLPADVRAGIDHTIHAKANLLESAIRGGSSLEALHRMLGPTQEEQWSAMQRVQAMESLAPACKWGEIAPGPEASAARERWLNIADAQADYENRYY